MKRTPLIAALLLIAFSSHCLADRLLVEAESFERHGGWKLDTQFIEIMGSPYLLAHGLGTPVDDAQTTVRFPHAGRYRVFVRTKDWVARWQAPGAPGKFQVVIDGKPLPTTFGTTGAAWHWQDGGTVDIENQQTSLALHDLTGFAGRCDALYFTNEEDDVPPNETAPLSAWRKQTLGLPAEPPTTKQYDLVVVGGGYAGLGAAISAARMGCQVALIQDRPVLGGNGSSEVRVWAQGKIRRGKFPAIGEIIAELEDQAKKSPGTKEEFGDDKKLAIVQAEPNIALFLNCHAYRVDMADKQIAAVYAFNTKTSEEQRFVGRLFVDCTGHGTIGYLAGADYYTHDKGHMGMSNMWRWEEADTPQPFPEIPWALDLEMDDFPYPRDFHGQWFWESGFDKDPIADLELMRDWNLRAVYGAFNAMKNRGGRDDHRNARLTWIAYIGGPRESRLLRGDVILTRKDIVAKRDFPDGCVPSTWSIDLHYPKEQYAKKFPEDPFISIAVHDRSVDRHYGYPVPYRCFYSRNIPNLFMAGRCISVTHEALGTVRVMKTCGMMGEVVGKAASICVKQSCMPRDVYENYLPELNELLNLKGVVRRDTLAGEFYVRKDAQELPPADVEYVDPAKLPGIVVDDTQAKLTGDWTVGEGLAGYIGQHYIYHGAGTPAAARYEFTVPADGQYEVRVSYGNHPNRAAAALVTVVSAEGERQTRINQKERPPLKNGFISVGTFPFAADQPAAVIISNEQSKGTVHADAVQILPVKK